MSGGEADSGPADQPRDGDDSDGERYLRRRRYLMAAGSLAGVGILARHAEGRDDAVAARQANNTTDEVGGGLPPGAETVPVRNVPGATLTDRYTGLRVLAETPANAEAEERETYTDFVTPEEEHYIRNHYPTPEIDAGDWTVSLTGVDEEAIELSMFDVMNGFSTETVVHTMQCSGNGRSYFEPNVAGNQWTYGAVGNTAWTGTPVGDVLEAFDVDTSAGRYVSVMGGDAPEGADVFTRSIPMQKMMEDCILAYEMNGEPMYPEHGYPVRLVVPGYFGNNSVKWVERMHVMDTMVFGEEWEDGDQQTYTHWQQYSYRLVPAGEEPNLMPSIDEFDTQAQMSSEDVRHPYVYDQIVKSLVGYPGENSTVAPGLDGQVEVLGVAWAGDNEVERVEVSADGGDTWEDAEFFGPSPGPAAWRQFRYKWDADPGEYTLYSRATDDQGRTQPATISSPDEGLLEIRNNEFPWNQGGYCATAYEPHGVSVTVVEDEAAAANATAGNETATTPVGNETATTPAGNETG